MQNFLIFVAGIALGIWIGGKRGRTVPKNAGEDISGQAPKNGDNTISGRGGNLSESNVERRKGVEEQKAKIVDLLNTKGEIQNNDVETLLGISDATATRYLNELEQEGKVEQIGGTGRGVSYRLH
ncbi:MAG: DeoR family transcriptional regulator [Candidatus Taylorbacteria bacterium]|nr:DeoR family transcriptional regulator [Candidatus Taylorbacteria bacterium]